MNSISTKSDNKQPQNSFIKSSSIKSSPIKVVELFAGVGGFRLGLESSNATNNATNNASNNLLGNELNGNLNNDLNNKQYEIIWSNQWEPSTKMQHASMVYEAKFGTENHVNEDIETVDTDVIPDHDLMVGGFPCQDYSVATTLQNSKGLKGKKGVLWWSIHRILEEKGDSKPKYLLFENVDRLLKSPANQRGRDFAVMLQCLNQLGYAVEWRVINAAEYGMPQRRRRIFFLGYHKSSALYQAMVGTIVGTKANTTTDHNAHDWLTSKGILASAFPVENTPLHKQFTLPEDLVDITHNFSKGAKTSPFENTGAMINGEVFTSKTQPHYQGKHTVLGDILQTDEVPAEFYINDASLKNPKTITLQDDTIKVISTEQQMWQYLKGSKKEYRKTQAGFEYNYSEGAMVFPDALDNASRTIITGEGGKSPSRFKHVIQTDNGLRRLTPLELERLNMFPDNHTKLDGMTDTKRAFFMGNALVVGVIEKIAAELYRRINGEQVSE